MDDSPKKRRKQLLVVGAIIVILVLFASPWLWIDNGERLIESDFFQGKEVNLFQKPIESCKDSCDGSCYRVKWVPFGVRVSACSEDWYFVTFWGQRFHVE